VDRDEKFPGFRGPSQIHPLDIVEGRPSVSNGVGLDEISALVDDGDHGLLLVEGYLEGVPLVQGKSLLLTKIFLFLQILADSRLTRSRKFNPPSHQESE